MTGEKRIVPVLNWDHHHQVERLVSLITLKIEQELAKANPDSTLLNALNDSLREYNKYLFE